MCHGSEAYAQRGATHKPQWEYADLHRRERNVHMFRPIQVGQCGG